MFGFIYQVLLVWDALRLKNTIQVIGLVLYNIGLMIYAAIQFDQIRDAVDALRGKIENDFWEEVRPMLIALPCVMAIGTILFAFIAWKLYDEFAWTIYKHISADLRLKRRYLTYQVRFRHLFGLPYHVRLLTCTLDLHCPSQIRRLLLPRLHRPIPRRGPQHH